MLCCPECGSIYITCIGTAPEDDPEGLYRCWECETEFLESDADTIVEEEDDS